MKHLKLIFACLLTAIFSIGQVWAADVAAYTLTVASTGGNSSPHNSYAAAATTTISGIEWSVLGNSNQSPWRLGGKESNCSGVDRDVHSNTAISDNISKIEITHGTASNITVNSMTVIVSKNADFSSPISTLTPEFVAEDVVTVNRPDGKDWSNCYYKFVYNLSVSGNSNRFVQFSGAVFYKEAGATSACANPTFSPTAGSVLSGTTVTLSTTTEDADIYYTMGDAPADPTSGSTKYSAPITITEATTIKAIAIKDGFDNSSVVSASYTVVAPLTTMQAVFDAATTAGGTAADVYITFDNWQISGVKNSNAFLTDGAKGAVIYGSGGSGFAENNVLSGTAACKVQLFKQFAEITTLTASSTGLTVTAGSALTPAVKTIDQLSAVNTGALVTVENLDYNGTNLSDGENTIVTYNTFYSASLENGKKYSITGVFQYYDGTKQLLPRSAADVVEVVAAAAPATPTFLPAAGTYTSVQSVELSCATEGATIYYTTDGSTPDDSKTEYTSAISVGENLTIKAIAIKDDLSSAVATAIYTINLPEDENVQKTWDLSIDETATAGESALTWTATYVDMSFAKGTSTTAANNYYPGTSGQSYTSTRAYKNSVITITPASSKQITTVVFTATTSGYATTLKNAAWTNATAASSDVTVTVTASGSGAISAVLGGTTGISSVTVHYEPYVAPTMYAVSFATPEHGSLAIANGVTPIASGDEFVAGAELTVSAEPTSGYVLDAIKVIETGSDPENDVTSTVLSGTTLTVPAYAITVSAAFVENVAPAATLTLSENGVTTSLAGEHHQGDVVTLPLTSSADCVKDFVGWSANASCAVAPEYAPGAEYTLASTSQTLYAVYATASGTSYVKTALASIASGSEVVITELYDEKIYAAANDGGTSSGPAEVELTETSNVLNVGSNTNIFWIITKDGDNFSFTVKDGTTKLYCTNTNNGVRVGTNENNIFSIKDNYLFNNATSRYVGYNHQEGGLFRCYTSINSNINNETLAFYKKTASYSDFATTCVAALADPEFTPAAGVYSETKNIVITAEEGTIYYTLDGTDPTSSSTEYTAPIVLDANGTTTIKAIAISATSQSAVVSATYTISLPLSTIDAIFEAATAAGGTAADANITFGNWVVSGVSTNGKNVFVTDGTKGFIIFDNGGEMGFEVGNVLSGTVACKVQLYSGAAELTTISSSTEGLSVAPGGVITPVEKAISALSGINTGAPVTIIGVQFDGTNLSDGTNSIKPFNSLFAYEALENDKYYNVTGIYQQFGSTKEILPRSAADIVESALLDPELSYSPATLTITEGDDWSAPTLNNPHSLAIASYGSNNESVATVTDGGVIALAGGLGTAVITAHTNGNATYAAGNATYTITVNAPAPTPSGTTYRKVTATENITDGEYLIVYEGDATHNAVAFDGSLDDVDQAKKGVAVTISEGVIAGTAAIDAAVFTINVTAGTLQSASGWYIGREANSNGMDKSETTQYVNTFAITDGVAVITGVGACTLRYNYASDQLRFRYYKSGQQDIQLYKKESSEPVYTTVRTGLTAGNYYTVCWPKAMTAIKGATLWSFAGKDASMAYLIQVDAPFVAGRPYIIYATADKLEAVVEGDDADAGSNNGLYGTLDYMDADALEAAGATYMLKNNELRPIGTNNHLDANRAYVILENISGGAPSGMPAHKVRAIPMQGTEAQGVDNLNASETPVKMMIDGQIFIIRGEKMYDATGRLVK